MGRQRLHIKGSALTALVGRALVVLLAVLLVWYGAMLVLLALKLDPRTINDLSGYRDAYDYLSTLQPADIDRLAVAITGLVVALAAGALVWRGLPRPHLARSALSLPENGHGRTDIQPRALERAVETAAIEHPAVSRPAAATTTAHSHSRSPRQMRATPSRHCARCATARSKASPATSSRSAP